MITERPDSTNVEIEPQDIARTTGGTETVLVWRARVRVVGLGVTLDHEVRSSEILGLTDRAREEAITLWQKSLTRVN